MKTKHTKHTSLIRPNGGEFHFNEWAIIGAPCDIITPFAKELNDILKSKLKLSYIDASHKKGRKPSSFHMSYTDKISHKILALSADPGQKQFRKYFADLDAVLINGNHFVGDKQIVLINEDKKESLQKKLDRLTNVKMIILQNPEDEIYSFLLEHIENVDAVKLFTIDQTDKIAKAILDDLHESMPALYGLVLSGGKSQRMGEDKGAISYHGKAQREYEADMLAKHCNRTFISCRKNQDELIESSYKKVYDTFEGLGPYGGILSAFREQPNAAWITLACDLPYLNDQVIKQLIKSRNPHKVATCFYNPETDFPEPLLTIWEPRAYPVLLEFLSQGYSCPRKVLINTDIEMIKMSDPNQMANANNPEERLAAEQQIKLATN